MQDNANVCAHGDSKKTGRVCEHLAHKVSEEYYKSADHYRFFTGNGNDFVLLCSECARAPEDSKIHWRTVCDSCGRKIACGKRLGEAGRPEIKTRNGVVTIMHREVRSSGMPSSVIAAAPLGVTEAGGWLLLTDRHELVRLMTDVNAHVCRTLPVRPELEKGAPLSLHVSHDGRFAAITATYGRKGVVVDLEQNRILMELLRGDYQHEQCKFPVAFAEHDGKQVVIHGTDWNRLDITELPSGRLLTHREPTSYTDGQERPAHYLDYFQCSLTVSPDGSQVASNGWAWHPVGIVGTWSLKQWLSDNVWESEDGASKKTLCWRTYYWDGPLCWIDEHTLAVWGLGDDDLVLTPGVRLFDVDRGEEKFSFAGPVGGSRHDTLQMGGEKEEFIHGAGNLVYDRWLFSWMEGKPFSIWDINDGARLWEETEFTPLGYHSGKRQFLSVTPDGSLCVSHVQNIASG